MNRTSIEWLVPECNGTGLPGYTWNPTHGCSPVSEGFSSPAAALS